MPWKPAMAEKNKLVSANHHNLEIAGFEGFRKKTLLNLNKTLCNFLTRGLPNIIAEHVSNDISLLLDCDDWQFNKRPTCVSAIAGCQGMA